jgi:hypothetical protein
MAALHCTMLTAALLSPPLRHRHPPSHPLQLLEGVSGVDTISRFDIADFPTKFAAQVGAVPGVSAAPAAACQHRWLPQKVCRAGGC